MLSLACHPADCLSPSDCSCPDGGASFPLGSFRTRDQEGLLHKIGAQFTYQLFELIIIVDVKTNVCSKIMFLWNEMRVFGQPWDTPFKDSIKLDKPHEGAFVCRAQSLLHSTGLLWREAVGPGSVAGLSLLGGISWVPTMCQAAYGLLHSHFLSGSLYSFPGVASKLMWLKTVAMLFLIVLEARYSESISVGN